MKKVIIEEIDERLKEICIEICYEEDYVHFLIKSIIVKELSKRFPEIKQNYKTVIFGQVVIIQMKKQLESMLEIKVNYKKCTRKFTQIN